MKLLVGTRNPGKIAEIRELLAGLPYELVFPQDLGLDPLPEESDLESGTTFYENAILKARYFAERSGLPTVAEDSGLEVDALEGGPGVRSARWAGAQGAGADEANNRLLLEQLRGVTPPHRTARYRCVVAYLATPEASPQSVEAVTEGAILEAPRGADGFGYDPLFLSAELGRTFAEVSAPTKNRVSHRGRAFRALAELLFRSSGVDGEAGDPLQR